MSREAANALRLAAMNLLARREHSRQELARKLAAKFPQAADQISTVLDCLAGENLQSDQRFTEAFIGARIHRGQGPQRIVVELRERGISEALAESCLAAAQVDWVELAREVLSRRFGKKLATDYREKAKRMRFLQYRGFSSEQINAVFFADA